MQNKPWQDWKLVLKRYFTHPLYYPAGYTLNGSSGDIWRIRQLVLIIMEESNSTQWNLPQPNTSTNQHKRQLAGKSTEQIVNKLGAATSSERLCWTETLYASRLFSSALPALSHRRRSVLTNQELSYWFPTDIMDPLWESGIQRTNWNGSGQNRHFNIAPHLNRSQRVQIHISKFFNILQLAKRLLTSGALSRRWRSNAPIPWQH